MEWSSDTLQLDDDDDSDGGGVVDAAFTARSFLQINTEKW